MAKKRFYFGRSSQSVVEIDEDAQIYFDACLAAGGTIPDGAWKARYNLMFIRAKALDLWDHSDSWVFFAGHNRIAALIDLRDPNKQLDTVGDYGGDWTQGIGFNPVPGFAILHWFNPGDGGTYNFTQNNAAYHIFTMEKTAVTNSHDVSCYDSSYTSGMHINGNVDRVAVNSTETLDGTYKNPILSSYHYFGAKKISSAVIHSQENGITIDILTGVTSTAIENKRIGLLCAYNGAFLQNSGFESLNPQALSIWGDNTIDQVKVIELHNPFFASISSRGEIKIRVTFAGDSRTSDLDYPSLNNNAAYPKRVLDNLDTSNTVGVALGKANDTIANIAGKYAANVAPFRADFLQTDVLMGFFGTNSIAAGQTGLQVYNAIKAYFQAAANDGFHNIIFGEIDRAWISYIDMNQARTDYRAKMLLDFTVPLGANIWGPAPGITYAKAYVDLFAEPVFQDNDNFPDNVHPDEPESELIGDYGTDAILATI